MPFLRAFLLLTATAATAMAQTSSAPLPSNLGRNGDVVMMQPIPDGSSAAPGGLPGPRPSRIRVLAAADHDLYVRAFDAAGHGDWRTARSLAAQGQNPVARRLLEWRYALDRDSGATFAEIDAVMRDTDSKTAAGTWPLRGTLQARAEAADHPRHAGFRQVIAWFAAKTPNSSIGKIRLGEALIANGDTTRGAALIRAGWSEGSFDTSIEQAILQKDAAVLTPESDRARLDALLWRGEITAARRQVSRVDAATAEIANGRIALPAFGLAQGRGAARHKVRDSPGSRPVVRLEPGARGWRIATRRPTPAAAHRLRPTWRRTTPPAGGPKSMSRRAMPWPPAMPGSRLTLVQHAGLPAGDQYAEQQFLAGFIALRFLKEPSQRACRIPEPGRRRIAPHQQVAGAILARPHL